MKGNIIKRMVESVKRKGVSGFLKSAAADLLEEISGFLVSMRDHNSSYRFVDRGEGKKSLVIVLVGYKSYLWPATLTRIHNNQPNDADVCLASAGICSTVLSELCVRNGWSYLSVKRNSPGVAINKAVLLHPNADYIYKLDEDVFVSNDYFSRLRIGYDSAWKSSMLEPGFVAPVLNVNGVSYRIMLREFNLEKSYQERFGQLISRCSDLPVHNDPNASWWLWKNTLPFDQKAERLAESVDLYSVCSTRFSIGAILFRREFFDKVGGFKSAWHSGVLGVDEDFFCRDCVSESRPMYIINSVLAGHFSFYPQEAFMIEKLPELSNLDPKTFPGIHYGKPLGKFS